MREACKAKRNNRIMQEVRKKLGKLLHPGYGPASQSLGLRNVS